MENIFEYYINLEQSVRQVQDLNSRGYHQEARDKEINELYPNFLKAYRAEKQLMRDHPGDEQFELINYADKHGV